MELNKLSVTVYIVETWKLQVCWFVRSPHTQSAHFLSFFVMELQSTKSVLEKEAGCVWYDVGRHHTWKFCWPLTKSFCLCCIWKRAAWCIVWRHCIRTVIVSSTSRANLRHACVRVKHVGVTVHQNRKLTFSEWFKWTLWWVDGEVWVCLIICKVLDEENPSRTGGWSCYVKDGWYCFILFLSLYYYISWKFHLPKMNKWPVFMTY